MFFIPLTQTESVELVIHALRAAGGAADCSTCPAARVCMKQCLAIAESVDRMLRSGTLPAITSEIEPTPPAAPPRRRGAAGATGLKLVK